MRIHVCHDPAMQLHLARFSRGPTTEMLDLHRVSMLWPGQWSSEWQWKLFLQTGLEISPIGLLLHEQILYDVTISLAR